MQSTLQALFRSTIAGVVVEVLTDTRTLKKRCALVARTEVQKTQEL